MSDKIRGRTKDLIFYDDVWEKLGGYE